MNAVDLRRTRVYLVLGAALLGCKGDCVTYPCPFTFGAELTVTAAGTDRPPADIAIGYVHGQGPDFQCDASGVCRSGMGVGTYQLVVSAPGYVAQQIEVNVTGAGPGCNTCGHVDTQRRTIVLTPT